MVTVSTLPANAVPTVSSVNTPTPVKSPDVWSQNFLIVATMPGFSFLKQRISRWRNAAAG